MRLAIPVIAGAAMVLYEGWRSYKERLGSRRRIRISCVSLEELHEIQRQDDIRKQRGYECIDDTSNYC